MNTTYFSGAAFALVCAIAALGAGDAYATRKTEPDRAKAGDLVWENRGQSESQGQAVAVAANHDIVVATGMTGDPDSICAVLTSNCHWFVRALDAKTGGTLWENRLATGDSSFGRASAVAIHAGRAFVAGWLRGAATLPFDFVVRAYRLNDGTALWERRINRSARSSERAYDVLVKNGRVYVSGNVINGTLRAFVLMVLDAQTGAILWESDTSGLRLGVAGAARVQGDRVFVAGSGSNPSVPVPSRTGNSLLVQAFNVKTGALLWENQVPDAFFFINGNSHDDLAVRGNLVFVTAAVLESDLSTNLPFDPMVRAYDARTGALVWVDHMHRQDGGEANRLGIGAGKLFVYDWDCDNPLNHCDGHVKAYVPKTGATVWEDRFTGPGGDTLIPNDAFDVRRGQVFIGASLLNAQQDQYQWTVRAYDADTGDVRWENRSVDPGFTNGPLALKAFGERVYVAGANDRTDGGSDFIVRTYRAGSDDDNDRDNDGDDDGDEDRD